MKFKITNEQFENFATLSKDLNPLHAQKKYVRDTPYKDLVFYGCGLTLLVFIKVGEKKRVKSVKTSFYSPVFLNDEVELKVEQKSKILNVKGFVGKAFAFEIDFEFSNEILTISKSLKSITFSKDYSLDQTEIKKYLTKSASSDEYDFSFIGMCSWVSFYTGMINPGVQAVLYSFEFSINSELETIDLSENSFHEVFRKQTVSGTFGVNNNFLIESFVRPEQVCPEFTYKADDKFMNDALRDKNVLVFGGISGFGKYVAKFFALYSRSIYIVHRRNTEDEESFLSEIDTGLRSKVVFIKDDINSEKSYDKLPVLNYVFFNASPKILKTNILEDRACDTIDTIQKYLKLGVNSFYKIKSCLKAETSEMFFFSSKYVEDLRIDYIEYTSSKVFMEHYFSSLGKALKIKIHNIRLPRMLTNQTNVILNSEETLTQESVFRSHIYPLLASEVSS